MTTKSFAKRRVRPSPVSAPEAAPQTVAEFVEQALTNAPTPPAREQAPRRPPARPSGIWADMTPEERSAHGKRLAAMRTSKQMERPHKRPRGPIGWAAEDAAAVKAQALVRAEALVVKLIDEGVIARDDFEGSQATVAALVQVATPGGNKEKKLRAAKRLLAHYGPAIEGQLNG